MEYDLQKIINKISLLCYKNKKPNIPVIIVFGVCFLIISILIITIVEAIARNIIWLSLIGGFILLLYFKRKKGSKHATTK